MNLTIHRGTHEIGGSCVEIESRGSRIVVDIGMPLVNKDGKRFDIKAYEHLSGPDLVKEGILPDIKGFYKWDNGGKRIDGVLISHAHQDHYGFFDYLHEDTHYYLSEGTKRIIDLNRIFCGTRGVVGRHTCVKAGTKVQMGHFIVTPFLMDHSAFDACAFLIECNGKSVFYSGDFRGHGRKAKAFQWLLNNPPKDIDALLLEGSMLGRDGGDLKTEDDIESEVFDILKNKNAIVFGYASSQNIDRLVSFYRAALKAKRTFVVDVYMANVLSELSDLGKIPHPSNKFSIVRVLFPRYICDRLVREGRKDLMVKFSQFKVTKKEISENPGNVLMMVRPSMTFDLSRIKGIEGATLIYSLWEGYMDDGPTRKFLNFVEKKGMEMVRIHTSGHASVGSLKKVVDAIRPKALIPIHTFHPDAYKNLFPDVNVLQASDGMKMSL